MSRGRDIKNKTSIEYTRSQSAVNQVDVSSIISLAVIAMIAFAVVATVLAAFALAITAALSKELWCMG